MRTARYVPLACAMAAALACAGDVMAEVEIQMQGGDVVFTARPERKPGTSAPMKRRAFRQAQAPPPEIESLVKEVSDRYDLDPSLVTAVIGVESGFDRLAVSPKGARGLMQLMPATAKQYGVRDVHDPRQNVEGGVAYLKDLLRAYNGDARLALAAYNAGPEAVAKAAGVPAYRETMDYLDRIEARYGRLGGASGRALAGAPSTPSARKVKTSQEDGVILLTNDPSRRGRPAAGGSRSGR